MPETEEKRPRKSDFLSTIEPYRINPDKWWADEQIEDVESLKPKPDRDVLLIVGDGHCALEDIQAFLSMDVPADLMCINFSPKLIPDNWKINHFIAGDSHTPSMQAMARLMEPETLCHCWNNNRRSSALVGKDPFHVRWARNTSKPWNGTTALLGIKIGIALGYMKIVLAGCPMDNGGNWYTTGLKQNDVKRAKNHTAHLWKWTEIASRPIGRFIRSLSGRTAELLGEPDRDWLLDC